MGLGTGTEEAKSPLHSATLKELRGGDLQQLFWSVELRTLGSGVEPERWLSPGPKVLT